jgi:VWFA-related protein
MPRFRCLPAVLAVGLVAGRGQDQDEPPPPTFRTEANYVRVDVFPTVRGTPVDDLRREDFEVLEDGVRQTIEQFEHVVIRGNVPQALRREPNTVAESRAMAQEPRARLFVLFLDIPHVSQASSRRIRQSLIDTLNGLIGPDDLVGVMTPDMSAADVTFARKTTTIEGVLDRSWWGSRDALIAQDPVEERYRFCYPNLTDPAAGASPLAREMIERRREKKTLDALSDLVVVLRGVREERKAVLAITEGWRLFTPNPGLTAPTPRDRPPGPPPLGVGPGGTLTTEDRRDPNVTTRNDCERDRIALSLIDDDVEFTRLLDQANRANTSFYPVDPRGLAAFDSSIGPDRPPSSGRDAAILRARISNLRRLAESTDGLAVVNTNNISGMLTRVVHDLSSYYLLGYYSSGKLDGKFHAITVRVKRPGVTVRARRGYLAATREEAESLSARPTASDAEAAEAHAIAGAIGPLDAYARESPVRLEAAAGWTGAGTAAIRIVGELGPGDEWKQGAQVDVLLTGGSATLASARAIVKPGARSFEVTLAPDGLTEPGEYAARVRARGDAAPWNDVLAIDLPAPPGTAGALLYRRGPATGGQERPTADRRFRRSERLRVEVPVSGEGPASARLLDRTGTPLAVPLETAARARPDGSRWASVQLALAPLGPSDYLIELTAGGVRTLVAFRIVR